MAIVCYFFVLADIGWLQFPQMLTGSSEISLTRTRSYKGRSQHLCWI